MKKLSKKGELTIIIAITIILMFVFYYTATWRVEQLDNGQAESEVK